MSETRRLETFRRRAAVGLTVAALIAVAHADPAAPAGPTPPARSVDVTVPDTAAASSTEPAPAVTGDRATVPRAPAPSPDAESTSPPSPGGTQVVSALAAGGIPPVALGAYTRAADASPAACHITWPLVAAIGRVESDHGRFAGAVLDADGRSSPRIIGIPLNGLGTALIHDTDGGRLDGDAVYDRAVGPLQFIPSTWSSHGR